MDEGDKEALVRSFITEAKNVFKLKISICNCDLKEAKNAGRNDVAEQKMTEQKELVGKFKKWKLDIKKFYGNTQFTPEIVSKLNAKTAHMKKEANRLCDILDQRGFRVDTSERLEDSEEKIIIEQTSETLVGDISRRSSFLNKSTDDKYPLKPEEYSARMNTSLDDHLKSARSYSRVENTSSEIKTDVNDRNSDDSLFSITWEDFVSYFIVENRKQHEADRLIETVIFKLVAHYWKYIEPFTQDGLVVPTDLRETWTLKSQWIKERNKALEDLVLEPYPFPKNFEGTMRSYIEFIDDAVVEVSIRILQASFFDSFRTTKIADFCANPTLDMFKEIVIDEIARHHEIFNNKRVDASAENRTHYERLKNERTHPFSRWMIEKIRLDYEVARLDESA